MKKYTDTIYIYNK